MVLELRDIRNHMKAGASASFELRGPAVSGQARTGSSEVRIIIQEIDDAKRYVTHGRVLSVVDVDKCLTQSARLLQFAADYIGRTAQGEGAAT